MRIFGSDFDEKFIVAFAAGGLFSGGIFCVAYKLLTRRKNGHSFSKLLDSKDITPGGEADLMLPVTLENEYGNSRQICLATDETASAFLTQLPQQFFQFQEKFAQLIIKSVENRKCTRALVIGSKTGALTFNLSKIFTQVKGIEPSFSQVATCFRFQNFESFYYNFPLEGALKTAKRVVSSPLLKTSSSPTPPSHKKIKEHERLEFINRDPSTVPDYIGEFELVVVNNCLNDLSDPEKFLNKLLSLVEYDGILVISSDYNWRRNTNQESGFGEFPVRNSFELLEFFLKDGFTLVSKVYIPEAICISNRTCKISNNHVTVWRRNSHK